MTLIGSLRLRISRGFLIGISSIGTGKIVRKTEFFEKIEIRKIGNNLTINNREKFRDRQMSSKNPVVSRNRRSNYPNWTVATYNETGSDSCQSQLTK